MTLKVIGAGFGRTGTLSLKTALEELGFGPCYHMEDVIKRPSRTKMWQKIVDGQSPNWDKVFAGYQATVDWPGCSYYPELMDAYPDAKVILSVRDPERWYNSAYNTIYALTKIPGAHRLPLVGQHIHFINDLAWNGTFHGRFEDPTYAMRIFEEHIAQVKATVPAERLLVFNVKEGWEPLCQFLGVPVPERQFPHANDRAVMEKRINHISQTAKWAPIGVTAFALLFAALLTYLFVNKKR